MAVDLIIVGVSDLSLTIKRTNVFKEHSSLILRQCSTSEAGSVEKILSRFFPRCESLLVLFINSLLRVEFGLLGLRLLEPVGLKGP